MAHRCSLLASLLVAGLLAGCGGENPELIPAADARQLTQLLDEAGAAAAAGNCEGAASQVRDARRINAALPRRTDAELKRNLREWLTHLEERIGSDCGAEPADPAPTAASEETATPEATPTETPSPTPTPEATEEPAEPTPDATEDPGSGGTPSPDEQPPLDDGVGEEG